MNDTGTPLRVLVIENCEDDALLLLRELRRGGYDLAWRRVETSAALDAALTQAEWDVIVCDWVMPRFSGAAALAQLRARGCKVPVIVVSGEVGEECAITAMQNGAADFVSKYALGRLVHVVARECRKAADHQRVEASLHRTQERLQLVFDTASDLILSVDSEGRMTSINPAVRTILGYEPEELVGRPVSELIAPEEVEKERVHLRSLWAGKSLPTPRDITLLTATGERRIVESLGRLVHWADGHAESFHIARDVTEARRRMVERERLSAALEQAPEPMVITDSDGRMLYLNAAGERLTGLTSRDVYGLPYAVMPADRGPEATPVLLAALIEGGDTWTGPVVYPCPDGRQLRVEVTVSPIRDHAGRVVNYLSRARPLPSAEPAEA